MIEGAVMATDTDKWHRIDLSRNDKPTDVVTAAVAVASRRASIDGEEIDKDQLDRVIVGTGSRRNSNNSSPTAENQQAPDSCAWQWRTLIPRYLNEETEALYVEHYTQEKFVAGCGILIGVLAFFTLAPFFISFPLLQVYAVAVAVIFLCIFIVFIVSQKLLKDDPRNQSQMHEGCVSAFVLLLNANMWILAKPKEIECIAFAEQLYEDDKIERLRPHPFCTDQLQTFYYIVIFGSLLWMRQRLARVIIGSILTTISWHASTIGWGANSVQTEFLVSLFNGFCLVLIVIFSRKLELISRKQFELQAETKRRQVALRNQSAGITELLMAIMPDNLLQRVQRAHEEQNALKMMNDGTTTNIHPSSSNVLIADYSETVTISFADLVNFTNFCSRLHPSAVAEYLTDFYAALDVQTAACDIDKIKTIGDAYWAVSGIPTAIVEDDHADRMAEFAFATLDVLNAVNEEHERDLTIRIGLHSGSALGGIISNSSMIYEVFGETNRIAKEACEAAHPNTICVTGDTAGCLSVARFDCTPVGGSTSKGQQEKPNTTLSGSYDMSASYEILDSTGLIRHELFAIVRTTRPVPSVGSTPSSKGLSAVQLNDGALPAPRFGGPGSSSDGGSEYTEQQSNTPVKRPGTASTATSSHSDTGAPQRHISSNIPLPPTAKKVAAAVENRRSVLSKQSKTTVSVSSIKLRESESSATTGAPLSHNHLQHQQPKHVALVADPPIDEEEAEREAMNMADAKVTMEQRFNIVRWMSSVGGAGGGAPGTLFAGGTGFTPVPSVDGSSMMDAHSLADPSELASNWDGLELPNEGHALFGDLRSDAGHSSGTGGGHDPDIPPHVQEMRSIKKRYGGPLMRFRNAEIEVQYWAEMRLASDSHVQLHSRCAILATCSLLLLFDGIQEEHPHDAAEAVLITSVIILAMAFAIYVKVGANYPKVQLACDLVASLCVAFFIIFVGFKTYSMIGNDPFYFRFVMGSFAPFVGSRYPALLVCITDFFFLAVPTLGWGLSKADTTYTPSLVASVLFSCVFLYSSLFFLERSRRREYLTSLTIASTTKLVEKDNKLQQKLLEAVVPDFIIPSLISWYQTGRHTDNIISYDLANVSIAFFELQSPTLATAFSVDALRDVRSDFTMVEELVSRRTTLTKLKNVGDLMIIAGPLDLSIHENATGTANEELLGLVMQLKQAFPAAAAALHCGRVTACIVGVTKVQLDIFGDTVNTCSRMADAAVSITAKKDTAQSKPSSAAPDVARSAVFASLAFWELETRQLKHSTESPCSPDADGAALSTTPGKVVAVVPSSRNPLVGPSTEGDENDALQATTSSTVAANSKRYRNAQIQQHHQTINNGTIFTGGYSKDDNVRVADIVSVLLRGKRTPMMLMAIEPLENTRRTKQLRKGDKKEADADEKIIQDDMLFDAESVVS